MCSRLLQRVAACCSVLQCVAVCCSVGNSTTFEERKRCRACAQHAKATAIRSRSVAVCCSVLHCSMLQEKGAEQVSNIKRAKHRTATHCNTLQHTATHCNTLQHTTTHCNTLQHTSQVALNTPRATALYFNAFHTCFWQKSPKYGAAPRRDILRCFLSMLSLCEGCSATPATHCNTLQHTVTHCNALQYTRTWTF